MRLLHSSGRLPVAAIDQQNQFISLLFQADLFFPDFHIFSFKERIIHKIQMNIILPDTNYQQLKPVQIKYIHQGTKY